MKCKSWLLAALLLIANIGAAQADTVEQLFETHQSPSPTTEQIKFEVSPFSIEHQVRLVMDARIDWPTLAGSNPWLRVAINGNYLTKEHLLNKRNSFKVGSGLDMTWASGDRWRILYSPDYEAAVTQKDAEMSAVNEDPYHFVWDITSMVKVGTNVLTLDNLKLIPEPTTMHFRNARIEVGKAIPPVVNDIVTPAPTDDVPLFVADEPAAFPMRARLAPDGGLRVLVAGKELNFSTKTSLPNGKWQETRPAIPGMEGQNERKLWQGQTASTNWKTPGYTVKREVSVRDSHVHIADTLTNTGKELIGVIVSHQLKYPEAPTSLKVAGRNSNVGANFSLEIPEHPSVFAQWPNLGLGMVAEDDVFRVHVKSFSDANGMGIADERLGINPGTSVTLEWNIYPVPGDAGKPGDYWDFVNAVRRDWGSNITIPGAFGFVPRFGEPKPAQWYVDWVRSRGLKIVTGSIAQFADHKYAHGTGILFAPEFVAHERDWTQKLQKAAPDVKVLAYFHGQLSNEPGGEEKYADSRLIGEKGEHVGYPYEFRMPLYLPTRENSYGKALWGFVNTLIDDIGVDGIYWDEMSHSVLRYVDQGPWDNHTVIIDPQTHALLGKRTSTQLVMQPLQLDIVRYARKKGKFMMANGQPFTRTMLREKLVRFVECQSYQTLYNTHFGCPIGLGNHEPEMSQADAARSIREMLERGALYYSDTIYQKDPPTWPFVSVMFPLTPVELREGAVLGVERIQTARSGRFGWPDGAAADIYIIDGKGLRVAEPSVKDVGEKGRHLYEIRMPSDHFAVLVKKSNP